MRDSKNQLQSLKKSLTRDNNLQTRTFQIKYLNAEYLLTIMLGDTGISTRFSESIELSLLIESVRMRGFTLSSGGLEVDTLFSMTVSMTRKASLPGINSLIVNCKA
jgi:hypothetical protein